VRKPDRSTTGGTAYLDLRKLASETSRPTDELHQLYALEGFLDRLTQSPHRDTFVLKGGVLLAAYVDRRPTRDVDLAAHQIQTDSDSIRTIVAAILEALDLHDVHLVGPDVGMGAALAYAANHSDHRLASMIVGNGPGAPGPFKLAMIINQLARFGFMRTSTGLLGAGPLICSRSQRMRSRPLCMVTAAPSRDGKRLRRQLRKLPSRSFVRLANQRLGRPNLAIPVWRRSAATCDDLWRGDLAHSSR